MVFREKTKRNPSILLVDDDPIQLEVLSDFVKTYNGNIQILKAADGIEALEIIKNNEQLNMVISDIQMPRLTGTELLKMVKELKPTLPVLLITGNLDYKIKDMLLLGALNLLFKPYSMKELHESIKSVLKV